MPAISRFRRLFLHWFSQPQSDRRLYRTAHWGQVRTIVELGVDTGRRALRMIEKATENVPTGEISYTGIDLFEARQDGVKTGLTIKDAYRQFKATGVKVRLAPGDPYGALSRVANELGTVDLLVISAQVDQESLARAWFFVPRFLDAGSRVYLEERRPDGKTAFRQLSLEEIERLASTARPVRRAA